jgi:hypothetical protein
VQEAEEGYWTDPWPVIMGRKPKHEQQFADPCGGLSRGELPADGPELDWQHRCARPSQPSTNNTFHSRAVFCVTCFGLTFGLKHGSVEVTRLRNETVLRHLHDAGYDFKDALAGIAELLKQQQRMVVAGSGLASPAAGWMTRQRKRESRRLDEAMKRYGKGFENAKHALNQSTTDVAVTVGQLVVHYYSKWKHSDEYNQWINTAEYHQQRQQQQRSDAVELQPSAGMIADGHSSSQKKAQRRQRRQGKRKREVKVRLIDSQLFALLKRMRK